MTDDIKDALRLTRDYEPALKEYRPSLKERIAASLMGDERPSPERRNFAEGLSELAYYVPGIGEAIAGDRLGRAIATDDYLTALKTVLGVIPGTGKFVTDKLPKAFGGQAYADNVAMVGAKKGGKINHIPDGDPYFRLAAGGEVENALRLARASGGKTPAWQRAEGKDPSGGLNAKGRASAKAEGMNLKPPAPHPKTEKDAARRKSFCARMSGSPGPMKDEKGRPTRKALSLRAWNCADGGAVDEAVKLASGGKPVWNKPRPKSLGKSEPLSKGQNASAKAAAKKAGRKYPNLVDNMRAARKGD